MGEFIQLAWHVPTGSTSPRQSIALWALSTIPNEVINRGPQRVVAGATAAPTDTFHSTAYPDGGSSNKSWRSQAQFSHQLDRPSATRAKRSTQNTEEIMKTSIAASPSLTRAWRLRASSAHSRKAESDSFLACAAKKKRSCRRRPRDDARRRSHLLPSVLVSRVFCEMLLFHNRIKFRAQYMVSR